MTITIGVDIGGSHVSCAAVDMRTLSIIKGSYFYSIINNKDCKNVILQAWANVINQTLEQVANSVVIGIGFAMPGPFNYKTGIALFEGNDKYESLYGVSITKELPKFLIRKDISIRFLNDATSFGIAGSLKGGALGNQNVLALTIGTGFGAAFLNNHIPLVYNENVPENGCLWDKMFSLGIADDYFSTRWFLKKYKEYTGEDIIKGVKEIVDKNNEFSKQIFNEFAENLATFLEPYVLKFDCKLLVLGGSIAKAHELFLPKMKKVWHQKNIKVEIQILENTEEENIIGASYSFNKRFWTMVEEELPLL